MLPAGRGKLTIGRREASDVPLTWDAKVSRAHALLEPVGQEWTLVDDGLSRNGSWVNGSRVHGRRRLHDRDRMCFGDTRVLFRDTAEERGSVSTARATGSPEAASLTERKRRVLIALCRPVVDLSSTTPATNPQIAAEVHLSVDAVKGVLRELFDQFGLGELGQNEKRSRLVAKVIDSGLLAPHDF
jgi:pSer/pThr/pTyr-binding forkhead associated (FHA) protein